MAFADLSFTAALWEGRGLRYVAASRELPPELSLMAEPAPPAPAPPAPALPAPAQPARPARTPGAPRPQRPARPAARPAQEAQRAVPGGAAPPTGASPRWRPLAPGALPPAWQSRLAATRPGLVGWTYWNLAQDLAAAGAKAPGDAAEAGARDVRRAFLARLLRELAHPAGTHTFWPACLPDGARGDPPGSGALAAHAEAFWSGAVHLGCRAVIVMGSAAVRALGLPAGARPLGQLRWRGQLVLVLREPDALAEDPARFGPTLAFLRQALGPVARCPR